MQNNITFFTEHLWLVIIAAVSGALFIFETFRQRAGKGLTPQGAINLMNQPNALVIDLRTPDEFTTGHLPNAKNIATADVEAKLSTLSKYKDKPVILIAAGGQKAANMTHKVIQQFKRAGFTQAYFLQDGIDAWKTAGLPTVNQNSTQKGS